MKSELQKQAQLQKEFNVHCNTRDFEISTLSLRISKNLVIYVLP